MLVLFYCNIHGKLHLCFNNQNTSCKRALWQRKVNKLVRNGSFTIIKNASIVNHHQILDYIIIMISPTGHHYLHMWNGNRKRLLIRNRKRCLIVIGSWKRKRWLIVIG